MSRSSFNFVVPLCVLVCMPAVATGQAVRGAAAPAAQATPPAPTELATYQRAVAERIERVSKMDVRRGAGESQVTALTVLGIKVDGKGEPVEVWVVRSSRQTALDQRARYSVFNAAPLPAPPASLLASGAPAEFSETWMFLADGRFQLLSAASRR
ncbi:MAG TPA: TonB C-terminal domain-containing protein [Burkholderiales bacterium]|nr:TonB C-terminal domain-containing protein [Burkholderiales bacterium]